MTLLDWIVSLIALGWLIAAAVFDIRTKQVPNILWNAIPFAIAILYRLIFGQVQIVVAGAVVTVIASERRQVRNGLVEAMILIAALLFFLWLFTTASGSTALGLVGICVFWVSWELHFIGGADAMALITCLLVWPGFGFVFAYLLAGVGWSVGVRIKEGGWRKAHWAPGLAIVASAAVIYLAVLVYMQVTA